MKFCEKTFVSWFNKDIDIAMRKIEKFDKTIVVCFVECMIDKKLLANNIIAPILRLKKSVSTQKIFDNLSTYNATIVEDKNQVVSNVLSGNVILFVEGAQNAISCNVADCKMRSVAEPPTSQVTKGPREGFVEDVNVNLSLIRKRLKSPNLAVKNIVVGKQTQTKIAIVYLADIADVKLAKEVENKLVNFEIDGIIDSYYITTILEDGKLKLLRRVGNSEKPDVVASRLLEGRIAIVVDGSPIVLTIPFLLIEDLQSPEDYYQIETRTSFLRILRLVGLVLGVLLPGFYVALQSYQYKVLPINFLVTLLSSIEGISLPPLLEILFVLFLFDILSEASARMPKILGMALSIIGALVLGETTVQAGIISPPSIVVVAISSIMLFIIPDDVPQIALLRILFTIVGGVAGFYGMLMAFVMASTYLVSADGYGVPLLSPYAPTSKHDKQDAILKKSLLALKKRPETIAKKNKTRLGDGDD